MTGAELRTIREAFGLSASVMGRALGYSGPKATVERQMRFFENEGRRIPPCVRRLAEMFKLHGIPKNWAY